MEILIRVLAAGFLLAPMAVAAEQRCWAGGDATGVLEFSGAVEGTAFTGVFGDFSVDYCMPEAGPAAGEIRVEVRLQSADSDNRDRDQTLKGPEFFDVDDHPRAAWRSTGIDAADGEYRASGRLTLKGITRAQAVRFTLTPDGSDLRATGEFTLAGSADVDRSRFNVGTGEFADPEFVRNRVDVRFDVTLERVD